MHRRRRRDAGRRPRRRHAANLGSRHGAEYITIRDDEHLLGECAFAPDGTLYDSSDDQIILFPLDPAERTALARHRVQREFSAEDCLRFDIVDCPAGST